MIPENHYCSLGKHYVRMKDVSPASRHRSGDACRECARKRIRENANKKLEESKRFNEQELFDDNNFGKIFI